MPLSSYGLCEAEIITPRSARIERASMATAGVGIGPKNLKKLRGRLRHPLPCHRPARAGDSVTSKGACATARIIEVSGYWVARIVLRRRPSFEGRAARGHLQDDGRPRRTRAMTSPS